VARPLRGAVRGAQALKDDHARGTLELAALRALVDGVRVALAQAGYATAPPAPPGSGDEAECAEYEATAEAFERIA